MVNMPSRRLVVFSFPPMQAAKLLVRSRAGLGVVSPGVQSTRLRTQTGVVGSCTRIQCLTPAHVTVRCLSSIDGFVSLILKVNFNCLDSCVNLILQ